MNRTLDRLTIAILSLICMAVSAVLIFTAIGWTSPVYWLDMAMSSLAGQWGLIAVSGILFIIFLIIFAKNIQRKPDTVSAVHENSLGIVRITLPALENLVLTAAHSVQGIREVKPLISSNAGGLVISLKAQVSTDTIIPSVSAELQRKVKEYVDKMAGTNVQEIHVSVTKISWESKSRVE